MRVDCTLSVGGVFLSVTFGETKATNVADYKSVIAQALTKDNAWMAPHQASILTRAAMLGLYMQCVDAVKQAREQGTAFDLVELPADKIDCIEIGYRGKAIAFVRLNAGAIGISYRGFPLVLFANPATDRLLPLPTSAALANEWAKSHVVDALSLLVKSS